jgi:hypothetical protein
LSAFGGNGLPAFFLAIVLHAEFWGRKYSAPSLVPSLSFPADLLRNCALVCSMIEGALKLKCVALLLCLFLFVAAVDTIPDPPALDPPGSGTVILARQFRAPALVTSIELQFLLESRFPGPVQLASLSLRLVLDDALVGGSRIPLVRHAADPSPPFLD